MIGQSAFAFLQKIGKALMLPVSVLPVAGILLGVGSAQFDWMPELLSSIMAQSGGAIFGSLAIWQCARPEHRARIGGIMLSAALTTWLTGITEPIEFAFLFVAPVLYT